MKRKLIIINLLFISIFLTSLKAQSIDPSIAQRYSSSIVARVYEIASKTDLSVQKQETLAILFQKQDSLLKDAILKLAGPVQIDQITKQTDSTFKSILTPAELNIYVKSESFNQNQICARAIAAAERRRSNGDEMLEQQLIGMYTAEFMEYARLEKQNMEDSVLLRAFKPIAVRYDTIRSKVVEGCLRRNYYAKRLKELNEIKALDGKTLTSLSNTFTWQCNHYKNRGYASNFTIAMQAVLKDTTYFGPLFRTEITSQAKYNAAKTTHTFAKQYKMTQTCVDQLYAAAYEKEKQLSAIEYTFPYHTNTKDSLISNVTAQFDSLTSRYLFNDGSNTPNSKFFASVKHKKELGLTQIQVDSLLAQGLELEKKIKKAKKEDNNFFSARKYEREHLSTILSEDQYTIILAILNRDKAHKYALSDWNGFKQYNITLSSDSSVVFKQIEDYELARSMAIDRYADDSSLKRKALDAIDETLPSEIRSLRVVKRQKSKETATSQKEKQYKGDFHW